MIKISIYYIMFNYYYYYELWLLWMKKLQQSHFASVRNDCTGGHL